MPKISKCIRECRVKTKGFMMSLISGAIMRNLSGTADIFRLKECFSLGRFLLILNSLGENDELSGKRDRRTCKSASRNT